MSLKALKQLAIACYNLVASKVQLFQSTKCQSLSKQSSHNKEQTGIGLYFSVPFFSFPSEDPAQLSFSYIFLHFILITARL